MKLQLSKIQKTIVNHDDGALLVVAGPGSGKTRVLTERIRRLLFETKGHFRVLALTFTNKAANEMKERLEEFPDINQRAFIGTMHSFCNEVLATRGKSVGINEMPHIFELFQDRKQVLAQAVEDDPDLKKQLKWSGDKKEQDKLLWRWLNMIGEAKNNLLLPEMLDDEIDRKIYVAYDKSLRASNAVDYDDLLLLTYRLFTERPKIADFYRRQYKYICIDESQDLNEAQYQVLKALCGSSYRNVMMVGDPKQAIFMWNGAHPKYLDMFEEDFKAKKIPMDENFRSSQAVVNAARKLTPEYEVEGQIPIKGDIRLIHGENEEDEALLVLDYIENLINNGHKDIEGHVALGQCAILARNRYVFSAIEAKLKEKNWEFYKQLSTQHESESDLLKDFVLCLRLLANPHDRLHFDLLLKRWGLSVKPQQVKSCDNGLKLIQAFQNYNLNKNQTAVLQAIKAMQWSENDFRFVKALDSLDSFAKSLENEEESAMIMQDTREWRKVWDIYLRSEIGGSRSITSFLGQVALGATQQPGQDGLALLTIHSAKGLEFDVVVIMGMTEGTFPDYRATDAALKEEKRNAFVAVTRSKRLLCFSFPDIKVMPWGDYKVQKPSRYLKEIGLL